MVDGDVVCIVEVQHIVTVLLSTGFSIYLACLEVGLVGGDVV